MTLIKTTPYTKHLKRVQYYTYMKMSLLLDYIKEMKKKLFNPLRKNSLEYYIHDVDEHNQRVITRFSSGTKLYLPFKAFNAIIDYLIDNNDRFVRIGSIHNKSTDHDTLEYVIQSLDPERKSHTKRAVHISDILHECGFVDFGKAVNQKTGRLCQAVKWRKL
jgi:hypothetical protein